MTPAGGFNAWHFNYTDTDTDRGFRHLILVGALGTAFGPGHTWDVNNDQQIIDLSSLDVISNHVTSAVNRLAMPPDDGYPSTEGVFVLANAVKQLL
ncbi:hypothetical protein [Streptomyces umbrinus]|uniref:hypothetical protein n=1 Tax=Streptomyces umbrinus TaxID=67370 RepID=UPI003429E830